MKLKKSSIRNFLHEKYPPSLPCSCPICTSFCLRPGWWTVGEARAALTAGYGQRMMLEISPDFTYAVLAPAFKGGEGGYAFQCHAQNGCTFLTNGLCELHGTGFQPLECRFCHHSRMGLGRLCHQDIEKDWRTRAGQALVLKWLRLNGKLNE